MSGARKRDAGRGRYQTIVLIEYYAPIASIAEGNKVEIADVGLEREMT